MSITLFSALFLFPGPAPGPWRQRPSGRHAATARARIESSSQMPSVYDLKPAFQRLLRPLTRGLAAAGVSANQVTVAAAVLSLAVGGLITWQPGNSRLLLLLPATLLLRMALNAVDGLLAREHGMQSALGGMLNEL